MSTLLTSRRSFIAGGAAIAAALGIGGASLVLLKDRDLLRSMLERLVGPFRMTDENLIAFTRAFMAQYENELRIAALRLAEAAGVKSGGILANGMRSIDARLDAFERRLVTLFLMSSTYLDENDPETADVNYLGGLNVRLDMCGNPFAIFDIDPWS